jgi:hypothetical protein
MRAEGDLGPFVAGRRASVVAGSKVSVGVMMPDLRRDNPRTVRQTALFCLSPASNRCFAMAVFE